MDFFDKVIFDNTIRSLLAVIGTIAIVFLLKGLISKYLAALLSAVINKFWKIDEKTFKKLIIRPLSWLLVIVVSVIALDKLNFPGAWGYKIYGFTIQRIFEIIGACLIIIAFIKFILKLVDFIALVLQQKVVPTRHRGENQMIGFFRDFLKVVIGLLGVMWLIKSGFGQPVGPLLTGLSIVGAAIALAAKESLENLIASFIIFFDKPFFVGDLLKVNNVTGTVERIGLRSTRIRTGEKTLVTIPNKQMVDGIVDNLSMQTQRRAEIKMELNNSAKTTDLEKLIGEVRAMLEGKNNQIIGSNVYLTDFNKNGITLFIEYFTRPFEYKDYLALKQEVIIFVRGKIEEFSLDIQTAMPDIKIYNQEDPQPQPPPNKPII